MKVITVDGTSLTCAQVAAIAVGAEVRVAAVARARAQRSMEVGSAAAQSRPLYGRSTGVGANRNVAVTGEGRGHVLALLRSHATSAGPPRGADRVRATLAIRLNQLAAGGSGVHPEMLDGLAAMLTADALPVIRELGSIGTGDLSALASTALALLGEAPTTHPLTAQIAFGPADGLAFISSNAAALADAALSLDSLAGSARAAPVIAAMTFVALRGNAEAFAPAVERATPFPGAIRVCRLMRSLIDNLVESPARIQDPFGLRILPQVHGPVLDALDYATSVIDRLINAPSENPLILAGDEIAARRSAEADGSGSARGGANSQQPEDGPEDEPDDVGSESDGAQVAHHGGFFSAYLQMAMDGLNLAVAQSGQSVLARLAALVDPDLSDLTPFLADGTAGASGVMVCEYVAASALGQIRAAAQPAGLQTATLSRGVEEDASFASLAAANTLRIAGHYPALLACELVPAVRALRMRRVRVTGPLARAIQICRELPDDMADRDLTADLALAEGLVHRLAEPLGG